MRSVSLTQRLVSRVRRGRPLAIAVGAGVVTLAACAELTSLEQDAPSRVLSREVVTPENVELLVTSLISDYECALAAYIVTTAHIGDEFIDAQLSQAGWDYDRRTILPSFNTYSGIACGAAQVTGLYTPLQVARYQAQITLDALQGWTDEQVANRSLYAATAAAHAGYAITLLGESMCSAAIDLGPEMSRAELLALAEQRFTTAIDAATTANNSSVLNMARVGRARVRLAQNKTAEARADAVLVPAGFVREATYSAAPAPTRRQNIVNTQQFLGLFASVDTSFRNLTFGGVPDPRVQVSDAGRNGHDGTTRVWRADKYPAASSPIPIASYDEAQLIVAEIDAASGTPTGIASAVAIINGLHSRVGLPPYAGGTAAEVLAQVREERRRELFLEGQRFGDIIRLDVTVRPLAGTPFAKGSNYGPDRGAQLCLPVPDLEKNNNPNF